MVASGKRSARAKRVAEFKSQLGGMDDIFAREEQRKIESNRQYEAMLRSKACESKNRYASASEAQAAIVACADYGTRGLRSYRCPYCNGWHLTSKKPSE